MGVFGPPPRAFANPDDHATGHDPSQPSVTSAKPSLSDRFSDSALCKPLYSCNPTAMTVTVTVLRPANWTDVNLACLVGPWIQTAMTCR